MAEKKKYPERIYTVRKGDAPLEEIVGGRWGREQAYLTGVGDGLLMRPQADPLAGCSLLNVSHPDWERIDWKQLRGVTAKLINADAGIFIETEVSPAGPYTVGRDEGPHQVSAQRALILKSPPEMTSSALYGPTQSALDGNGGWSLWVEGEIPVKTGTAAELKYGSIFKGKCPNGETQEFLVAYTADGGKCLIESDIFKALSEYQPTQVEVVEVLSGGFIDAKEEA